MPPAYQGPTVEELEVSPLLVPLDSDELDEMAVELRGGESRWVPGVGLNGCPATAQHQGRTVFCTALPAADGGAHVHRYGLRSFDALDGEG